MGRFKSKYLPTTCLILPECLHFRLDPNQAGTLVPNDSLTLPDLKTLTHRFHVHLFDFHKLSTYEEIFNDTTRQRQAIQKKYCKTNALALTLRT